MALPGGLRQDLRQAHLHLPLACTWISSRRKVRTNSRRSGSSGAQSISFNSHPAGLWAIGFLRRNLSSVGSDAVILGNTYLALWNGIVKVPPAGLEERASTLNPPPWQVLVASPHPLLFRHFPPLVWEQGLEFIIQLQGLPLRRFSKGGYSLSQLPSMLIFLCSQTKISVTVPCHQVKSKETRQVFGVIGKIQEQK